MPVEAPETKTQRFGAGLPQTGQRALSSSEQAALQDQLRRFKHGAAACMLVLLALAGAAPSLGSNLDPVVVERLAGSPGLFVLSLGCLGAVGALLRGRGAWRTLTVVPCLALLVGLAQPQVFPGLPPLHPSLGKALFLALVLVGSAFGVAFGRKRLRVLARIAAIRRDLEAGEVHCFEGAVGSMPPDEALQELQEQHVLAPDLRPHTLDLLPRSGLVVRADGNPPSKLCVAFVTEVAAAAPHAFRTALPRGVEVEDKALNLRRRSLTPAERVELERHIRRLRRHFLPSLLVTLMPALLLAFDNVHAGQEGKPLLVVTLAWLALALWTYVAYARRLFVARKLDSDRELRWVVTVDDDKQADTVDAPPKLEVLPISQLAWTEGAKPAFWRRTEY